MGAVGLVADPINVGVGQQISDEIEFGGAGLAVAAGHGPDRAAVEVDAVVAVLNLLEISQIALFIEKLGHDVDPFVDRPTRDPIPSSLDQSLTATVEDAGHQLGVFLFDLFENLDRQPRVVADEERFGCLGGVIVIGRTSWLTAFSFSSDEARRSQCAEVLTNGTRRDVEPDREFICGRLAESFQRDEHRALRWRKIGDRSVHSIKLAPFAMFSVFHKVKLVKVGNRW